MTHAPWRDAALARLERETFDVLVVGGGATGAAIARDAALRGLHVALCERGDFAAETSSHSSKLIHGGLRYLEHGNFPLVFEALAERHRLLTTAPHLCRPCEFVFPFFRGQRPTRREVGLGVQLYDALALWRAPVKSRQLEASELYALLPALRSAGLLGAWSYVDCQTDDARLVLEHVLDAQTAGAAVASQVEVARPGPRRGHLHVLELTDRLSGATLTARARALVNATGPFVDAFQDGAPVLRPTLGVHIVVDAHRLPTGGRALVLRHPRDGRVLFTLPAGNRTILGTTDTDFEPASGVPRPGSPIAARRADVDYLLEAARYAFPSARLDREHVLATFAGLRPLLAGPASDPSATSREHEVWLDRAGVLAVAGGKLTTMRRMGEDATDAVVELLRARGLEHGTLPCATHARALPGGGPPATRALENHELAEDVRSHLAATYGGRAHLVAALAASSPELGRRLFPGDGTASRAQHHAPALPFLRAEVVFAIRHDVALEVDDVLRRRLPIYYRAPEQGLSVVEDVADLMAAELAWSSARRALSVASYRTAVDQARAWQREH